MPNSVLVLVSDLDNAAHGEVNVAESAEAAARLVETLIESGYDQNRIRVFACDEFQIEVHHQPIVSLRAPAATGRDSSAEEPAPESADEADEPAEVEAATARATTAASALALEAAPQPFVRNGVRFSNQFGPA